MIAQRLISVANISKSNTRKSSSVRRDVKSRSLVNRATTSVLAFTRDISHIPSANRSIPNSTTLLFHGRKNQITVRTYATELPQHTKIGLPALSPTMETGNLAKWRKKEGEKIKPGDIIAEIETDKATVDFEATDEGYLAKILIPEGTKDLPVGKLIGIMVEEKGDIAAFAQYKGEEAPASAAPKAASPEPPKAPEPAAPKQPSTPTPQPQVQQQTQNVVPGAPPVLSGFPKSGLLASPLAKVTAEQQQVNLGGIKGTGPGGRILQADVMETSQAKPVPQVGMSADSYTDVVNSNIRKVTAQRLTLSKQTIPHYYLTMECRVDNLLKMRTSLNDKANNTYKLSVNDFVIKAAALACRKVPAANSSWNGDSIRRYNYVDINVAVNTEKGLFTPIVKDADKLGLASISNAVKDLAEKAKANKLQPHEFSGGTFTISNLGMYGIKHFAAVINPPQACILAVGTSEKRVIVDDNATDKANPYSVGNFMSVTLSCDHRVVDGAIGAEWLKAFKEYIEDPMKMLL